MADKIINGSLEVTGQITQNNQPIEEPIETTWSGLVALRNAGELAPGRYYRITDYECTTTTANTSSAGHAFDIIVLALENDKLSEEAKACFSARDSLSSINGDGDKCVRYPEADGDFNGEHYYAFESLLSNDLFYYTKSLTDIPTESSCFIGYNGASSGIPISEATEVLSFEDDGISLIGYEGLYFANTNIPSWRIWYCLDNDTSRFFWADTTNGKGVIYRMIDEFNNDLPYDFKNILYEGVDGIGIGYLRSINDEGYVLYRNPDSDITISDVPYYAWTYSSALGTVTLFTTTTSPTKESQLYNSDGSQCYDEIDIFLERGWEGDSYTFGWTNSSEVLVDASMDGSLNTTGNIIAPSAEIGVMQLPRNVFYSFRYWYNKPNWKFNNIGGNSSWNTFAEGCRNNSFGERAVGNKLDASISNKFGDSCQFNDLPTCYNNNIGNGFSSNKFTTLQGCTISTGCYSNSMSLSECNIGPQSHNNTGTLRNCTLNESVSNNNFNNCSYCYFGNGVSSNTFASNTMYCYFGEGLSSSYIGYDGTAYDAWISNLRIEAGVKYIILTTSDKKATQSNRLQNIHINSGIQGASTSNRLVISVYARNLPNEVEYFLDDSGNLVYSNFVSSITYNALRQLRDNGNLVPGRKYRITDYLTSTAQANTSSVGHQFDLIVEALTSSSLSEEASACLHEGDTYFANSILSAWKLKYCLDNDTSRFAWANNASTTITDSITYSSSTYGNVKLYRNPSRDFSQTYTARYCWSNGGPEWFFENEYPSVGDLGHPYHPNESSDGSVQSVNTHNEYTYHGVIYRMIDEFGNDCPYDFKNIQFVGVASVKIKNYGEYYKGSMSRLESSDVTIGDILYYAFLFHMTADPSVSETYYTRSLTDMSTWYAISGDTVTVTDNVIVTVYAGITVGAFYYTFSVGSADASINGASNKVYLNTIGKYVKNGIQTLNYNMFIVSSGTLNCCNNQIGVQNHDNIIGANFNTNIIGSSFRSNFINSGFQYNAIGSNCFDNAIGSNFQVNAIDQYFSSNEIGTNFASNTIGTNFSYNTIGSSFNGNTIGSSFGSNIIGTNFYKNDIGTAFSSNFIGNGFQQSTIGCFFGSNTIGNNFLVNTIGSSFQNNTIDAYFQGNTVGSSFQYNAIGSYVKWSEMEDGCKYLTIDATGGSTSEYIQYAKVCRSLKGASVVNRLTITPVRNVTYEQEFVNANKVTTQINV